MSNQKSNIPKLVGILLFLLALVALNIYQYSKGNEIQKESTEMQAQVQELKIVNTELDEAYDEARASLDNLQSDNKKLNDLIDKQKEQLRIQKNKINNYIWTKKELSKAKEEIQVLNNQVNGFIQEINRLKRENQDLKSTNASLNNRNVVLKQENTNLATTVTKERQEKAVVIQEKKVVEEKNANLSAENVKLNSTVDVASAIKVKYVEVKGYKANSDGSKGRRRKKAKNVEILQMCFVTAANVVNKDTNPRFHFRIVGPRGETLLDEIGSGVITDKQTGNKIRFTKSGTIKYTGEPATACLDWKPQNKLEKGEYYLEIYNNGFKVNESQFKLK